MGLIGKYIWLFSARSQIDPVFYDNGDEHTASTGGWFAAHGTITRNRTNIFTKASSNTVANSGALQTTNGFNLAGYTSLKFIITATGSYESRVGLVTTAGGYLDADFATNGSKNYYYNASNIGSNKTITIDISDLPAGTYYPTIRTRATAAGIYLYKCWVE